MKLQERLLKTAGSAAVAAFLAFFDDSGARQLQKGRLPDVDADNGRMPIVRARPRGETTALGGGWNGYGRDAQHSGLSSVKSDDLNGIHWQTPVDLQPQNFGGELFVHYGSPLVTPHNTVIVPVKTGVDGDFRVEARSGGDGTLQWSLTTDYILPPHNWLPVFGPVLAGSRLYFPGAGGTVYFRDQPDEAAGAQGQIAFYGLSSYQADPSDYNAGVMICTPLTADASGNIYFGFLVIGGTPIDLQSGIARISASGAGTWTTAAAAAADPSITRVVQNCAPALSADGRTVYVAVSGNVGYLVALDSATLAPLHRAPLLDPHTGQVAVLLNDGSASPTVGPDGDVYFGVLESPLPSNHTRGWLLHFDGTLSQSKIPGAFGWDDTAAVVPASMVPSYHGASAYLLLSKYNNYTESGGDGLNKLAILDPNATERDPITGATVMKEVLTILGPTPTAPRGVKEWCINSAVVDPATESVLAGSEDGILYRWDLVTNTLSQAVVLTTGLTEAYTPTLIGVDGTVYAINNAILFAVGK